MKHLAIGFLILAFCLVVGMPSEAEIDPAKAETVWLFDDGAGGKVVDSSGHKRNGTIVGKDKWVKGKFGGGLELNGTQNNEVIIEGYKGIGGNSPRTTVLWYWTQKAGRCRLVCWGANDTAIKYHVRIHEGDTFRVETQGGQLFANKPKLTDGEWHHLACVFPPGGKMCHDHILYVDGVEIKDRGGNNVGVDTDTKTNDVEIGWNKWGGHGDPAQGVFDEVAIFSTALSEKDVNDIMNKGLAVALSVSPKEKLTTIWGSLKTIRYLGN